MLFFGCRTPKHDDLYREELNTWQALGAVEMRRAYSRAPERSNGCKYVQDRMWADRADLLELWKWDAKVYVCGSRGVANSARDMFIRFRVEMQEQQGEKTDAAAAGEWFESLRNMRYVTDVFD